jgi:hypothetical protein
MRNSHKPSKEETARCIYFWFAILIVLRQCCTTETARLSSGLLKHAAPTAYESPLSSGASACLFFHTTFRAGASTTYRFCTLNLILPWHSPESCRLFTVPGVLNIIVIQYAQTWTAGKFRLEFAGVGIAREEWCKGMRKSKTRRREGLLLFSECAYQRNSR